MKIGPQLPKLLSNIKWLTLFGTLCILTRFTHVCLCPSVEAGYMVLQTTPNKNATQAASDDVMSI